MRRLDWMAALLLLPSTASAAGADDPALARGAHVAERECAGCHAVTLGVASPNPGAPTFAALRLRYNPISLERRLGAFQKQGHEAMPPQSLMASDISDLIAYIQALESPSQRP